MEANHRIATYDKVYSTELNLNGEVWNFWQLIKISAEKWEEKTYGKMGKGIWVVALCGKRVIWYNDIEEGFNISHYRKYGTIDQYCDQYSLSESVTQLFQLVKFGGDVIGQASSPINH